MNINSARKYNPFTWIAGLRQASCDLVGKACLLDRRDGLMYFDPVKSLRRDKTITMPAIGSQLIDSGKFPELTRIEFPEDPEKIRDFIRSVIRTKMPIEQAATENGIRVEDLSRYYVRLAT